MKDRHRGFARVLSKLLQAITLILMLVMDAGCRDNRWTVYLCT